MTAAPKEKNGSASSALPSGLLRTLAMPYVPSLGAAYCLLKPSRSTLHFWLPYYMRTQLGFTDATAATCIGIYDAGCLVGSLVYSSALDHLTLGELFAPLCLLLAVLLLTLTSIATYGPVAFAAALALIGSTFGGLELLAGGSAAGCIIDEVGGSISDIPVCMLSLVQPRTT